jgi:hypothetical protein
LNRFTQTVRIWALFLVPAGILGASDAPTTRDEITHAFDRLYNFDFVGAHEALSRYASARPGDHLGPAVRSAVYLFYELSRLGILESQFFTDDRRIADKKKLKPDPELKRRLLATISAAEKTATLRLQGDPNDRRALFTLSITTGVLTDYVALIEKRQLGSLSHAKQSQSYAVRLLRLDPEFYDAYVTSGVSEYLVGSLPFFVRWFVRFEQIQGSKEKAIRNLELAARSGRYFGPFAKILLAIIHLREKRPRESERLLGELAREFPENPLFRDELAVLKERLGE